MLICLIGTGGTGKTTLARELEREFGMEYYPTPTRKVPVELRGTKEGQLMVHELYCEFFNDLMDKSWEKNIICDRSVFDVLAYSKAYGAWDDAFIKVKASQYFSSYIYPDLLFYLPIEFDLEPDGDREAFLSKRVAVDDAIKQILNDRGVKYVTLTGTVEERRNQVAQTILKYTSERD